jgi:hypothetical protein
VAVGEDSFGQGVRSLRVGTRQSAGAGAAVSARPPARGAEAVRRRARGIFVCEREVDPHNRQFVQNTSPRRARAAFCRS